MKHPNRLRVLRNRNGLTQRDVAQKTGLSVTAVNRHEQGNRRLSQNTIRLYAKVFNVEGVDLFLER